MMNKKNKHLQTDTNFHTYASTVLHCFKNCQDLYPNLLSRTDKVTLIDHVTYPDNNATNPDVFEREPEIALFQMVNCQNGSTSKTVFCFRTRVKLYFVLDLDTY